MSSVTPRYIGAEQVRAAISWPLLNEAVHEALKAVVHSEAEDIESVPQPFANQPARSQTTCGSSGKLLFTMPAYVGSYQLSSAEGDKNKVTCNTLACKLVTSFPANMQREPPLANILANILLFSTQTGQLECIMDGTLITAWRTAAASIVATKCLYFGRVGGANATFERAIKVAIIGCGVQGQSHALGMCASFCVSDIYLWNRTSSKADALAVELRAGAAAAKQTNVQVTASAAEAVADADVICVGTYAANALVELSMLKKPNVHINTVGAGQVHFGEVAQDIYDKATVYVDSWAGAKAELKDLKARIVAEIGEVIINANYPAAEGITIFQSMGMAAEDAAVAQAVYETIKCKESDALKNSKH